MRLLLPKDYFNKPDQKWPTLYLLHDPIHHYYDVTGVTTA